MFVLEIVTILTTIIFARHLATGGNDLLFTAQIVLWLWFTVFLPLRRGNRRRSRQGTSGFASRSTSRNAGEADDKARAEIISRSRARRLKSEDVVLVEAGDIIPSDGEVIEGVASVNEAAITGESAPVIRESAGDARQ